MVIAWVATPSLQATQADVESILALGSHEALGAFVLVDWLVHEGLGDKGVPVQAYFC
jgi:hypothetical protein